MLLSCTLTLRVQVQIDEVALRVRRMMGPDFNLLRSPSGDRLTATDTRVNFCVNFGGESAATPLRSGPLRQGPAAAGHRTGEIPAPVPVQREAFPRPIPGGDSARLPSRRARTPSRSEVLWQGCRASRRDALALQRSRRGMVHRP